MALVDFAFHHAVLAAVSGPPHVETIGGDSVPLQPALRFRAPAILTSRYQEHGCLGLPQTDPLVDEVDRLIDLVMLGATGILRTAVPEKGEGAVQIEDHALARRRHFLRNLMLHLRAHLHAAPLQRRSMPRRLCPERMHHRGNFGQSPRSWLVARGHSMSNPRAS